MYVKNTFSTCLHLYVCNYFIIEQNWNKHLIYSRLCFCLKELKYYIQGGKLEHFCLLWVQGLTQLNILCATTKVFFNLVVLNIVSFDICVRGQTLDLSVLVFILNIYI